MYKIYTKKNGVGLSPARNILLYMRLTIIILIATFMQVSAAGYAQKVSLNEKNVLIEKVFKEIRHQTGYDFIFNANLIQQDKRINIKVSNVTLEEALNVCLEGLPLTYTIEEKTVIIKRKELRTPNFAAMNADPVVYRGRVIDESGLPVIGATVRVKGKDKGTITDGDGRFMISGVSVNEILVFSYLGYETREIPAADGLMNVILISTPGELNEVLVVAYGTVKRSGFVGSLSQIKGEQLENRQVSNISKALQGLAPGIQVASASGQPGTQATIRIRGIGSINASSAPLYVVDGAPFQGDINSINVSDIASISVLKDASSSALYGSRGANGVIIITTKTGRSSDGTRINASFSRGVSNRAVKDYKQMNTDQYFESYWLALRNKQLTNGLTDAQARTSASSRITKALGINPYGANYPEPVGLDGKIVPGAAPLWDDQWRDVLERNASRTQADLNFSGGSEKSQYFISGGYLNDKGIAIGSGFKRYNARVNLTTQAKKWLKAGLNLSASNTKQDYPQSEDSNTANIILVSRSIPSFYPVYQRNPDGSFIFDEKGNKAFDFGNYRPSSAMPRSNLAATTDLDRNEILTDNASIRTFLEASMLPGLKFKTSYSGDYKNINRNFYTNPLLGENAPIRGSVSRNNNREYSFTWNNIFTYEKTIHEDHHLNLLAGQEFYSDNVRQISGSRQGFVLPNLYEPDAAAQLNDFNGFADNYRLLSFFGRAEYDYKSKYFFSGSLRTDGSSRFSPETRWGTFWSLGGSWRASKEEFLSNSVWLNNLTFRASYGAQGNDDIGTFYAYDGLYSIYNNLGENGLVTKRLATPDLKWETNLNLNIGVDFGILKDRISGSVEYFNRASKNLLFSLPKALSTGFKSIDANIGALKNTGIEIQLNAVPVLTTDFKWTFSINATHYKNKITDLPQNNQIAGTKLLRVGGSINDFYIKEWAGVDPANGDPLWYKDNGKGEKVKTNDYTQASFYLEGTSLPDVLGGITNTFNYKQFELSAMLAYSLGGKVLDRDYASLLHNGNRTGGTWSEEMLNHWTPENPNTDVPRLTTDNLGWTQTSTRQLYSATYARLKTVTLGYNLPKKVSGRLGVQNLRVTLTGENLLTFYGHKGMDPEQTISGSTYFRYPAMRTVSAGINVTF
ncbi:TonB-linked SusC/RagA family outer membrane protein [Pedobacter cryoconitis]|uniref:TonB-linked SusC/RagA family outer membrane protein n=1 Tax=Pedobacter cryoconitis TaxID=188932 RepID=A0A7W9DZP7_9SPHI|nr:TonB-dependent receptor [Pedobacter cryoconitis]MBB5637206.1 TonB-linked SusC/RagA family outer membrane protein [Pedobacter cryoconitis]